MSHANREECIVKVVDAVWELRNLGKRTIEVTLEKQDFFLEPREVYEDIVTAEQEFEAQYTVVKIKTGHPEIGLELQQNGFWHVETQIIIRALHDDMKQAVEKFEPFYINIEQQEVTSYEDIAFIQKEIEKGIFSTDRIALDPVFGIDVANCRYANWVRDEFERGRHVVYTLVDGKRVAFTVYREEGLLHWGLLTGIFLDYASSNYGGALLYGGSADMVKKGISIVEGAVSSNNPVIFSLHEMFGYRLKSMLDVYTRHRT